MSIFLQRTTFDNRLGITKNQLFGTGGFSESFLTAKLTKSRLYFGVIKTEVYLKLNFLFTRIKSVI